MGTEPTKSRQARTREEQAYIEDLTEAITTVARLAHSNQLYEAMGSKAGIDMRPYLFGVLARIGDLQPTRISDVAQQVDYDRSTVSRHIGELVALGCVERLPDPADGRAALVKLTPMGRRTLRRIFEVWYETLADVTDGWSPAERSKFLKMLSSFGNAFADHLQAL